MVVEVKSSFCWKLDHTFWTSVIVRVGMTRINMVFNDGLVRTGITAAITTFGINWDFHGHIMVIRKNAINLANVDKVSTRE
jgi:hypothetical protein